jgi:2-iminoacetate synthase ThiH
MHCYDGSVINLKDSTNMLYTLQNIACDDWEVISYDDEEMKANAIRMETNTIE